ncbi:MAG: phosphotransferase [Chloroflexi bacterium]|nr:phosphotransferase [Chloroflexota bacterium]
MNTQELQAKLLIYYQLKFAAREQQTLADFRALTNGFASDVYAYTLTYRMGATVYHEPRVLKLYSAGVGGADRALKERHALRSLHEEGFPVPGSTLVEVDEGHLGRPFVIMEQVEGQTMWQALETASPERRRDLIRLFSGLLADLHSLSYAVLVPNLLIRDEYTLIKREIHNLKQGGTEFLPLVEWLQARRELVPCKRPVVTHRDYHPWNIIITEQGMYEGIIIDWGWQISDPRFDLGWTLSLMERAGHDDFRAAALDEYERIVGHKIEHLAYFEVLASAHWLLQVLNSLKSGAHLRNGARAGFRALVSDAAHKALDMIYARTGVKLPEVEAQIR